MRIVKQSKFKYNLIEEDAIRDLNGFPLEIIEKMIDNQVAQDNKPDVNIFKCFVATDRNSKGFNWNISKEGSDFWVDIISDRRFDVFFKRYPKK